MAGGKTFSNAIHQLFIGFSTETKPPLGPAQIGDQFHESDTGSVYEFDGIATWFLVGAAGTVAVGTIAVNDGADVTEGAKADAAWNGGSGSVVALLKAIAGAPLTYANITAAAPTATVVKASAGFLHSITINTPVAGSVITIYDHGSATGTKIGTITLPTPLLSDGPHTAIYDVNFATALTINTATAASDITVSYR